MESCKYVLTRLFVKSFLQYRVFVPKDPVRALQRPDLRLFGILCDLVCKEDGRDLVTAAVDSVQDRGRLHVENILYVQDVLQY